MTAYELAAALEGINAKQREQRDFIVQLCDGVKFSILEKITRIPANWDGHELRELIADHFNNARSRLLYDKRSKRRRDYDAACLTFDLL